MRRMVLVGVVVMFVVVLGVTKVMDREYDHGHEPRNKTESPVEISRSDPPKLDESKREADRVVAHFVRAFYSRPASLLSLGVDERMRRYGEKLEPYVTEEFLSDYLYPLTTPQDEELARLGGSVTANVVRYGPGHLDGASMDKEIEVRFVTQWPGAKPQHNKISILIYVTRQEDGWRVEAFEDLSVE